MLRTLLIFMVALTSTNRLTAGPQHDFFSKHCVDCHDKESKKAGLDLTALPAEPASHDEIASWIKIHDRIESGMMPPPQKKQPEKGDKAAILTWLKTTIIQAEQKKFRSKPRTAVRRLTRAEYENTLRDLFDMPGLNVQADLPPDGSAYGFDKTSEALDISHVNLAQYLEAADRVLDMAIATQPQAPQSRVQRISLANPHGFVAHVLLHGDGVLLKNKQPDPDFPPAGKHAHLGQGAHEQIGSFNTGSSVGLFRHEDESFSPYFIEFTSIYPARYRIKTSLWSFQWDKGKVLPSRGTEAARLSIVQMTGDGRGGGHPSSLLGYFDAPSLQEKVHEVETWLNSGETIGFNAASLVGGNTRGPGRLTSFVGPGIACDWLDVVGPIYATWPPPSHRVLFGDLPLVEFKPKPKSTVRPPKHSVLRQRYFGINKADPVKGIWTVRSDEPLIDAERLLASFLPKAFRRPVPSEVRKAYLAIVDKRLREGDCFESAMRWAYRAALCSSDFLYLIELPADAKDLPGNQPVRLDDESLASRLSYFLWNSQPDEQLIALAGSKKLHEADVLKQQVERLLKDPRSQRFREDFLGQWLKLRLIAANDPDNKLYPEFRPFLQDSMVAETRAYFKEMLDKDLNAGYLVKSDFAMINQRLAVHYGIPGVVGCQIRRVPLPIGSPRGSFLTQAAILKITANGTTTSPVPRGAFVMDRLLGLPPEPPPANITAVEPDVRGTTTIREQLAKHRNNTICASCHAKIDPPGFALESFDVIGGQRTRYRSIGSGDPAPRGAIDPFIGISFKLGLPVDPSGELGDGTKFKNINEYQDWIANKQDLLLKNIAERFTIYSTGRGLLFSDRAAIATLVARTQARGGGIRTLLHELVQSDLFQTP